MSEYSPAFFIFPAVCVVMIPVGWYLIHQTVVLEVLSKQANATNEGFEDNGESKQAHATNEGFVDDNCEATKPGKEHVDELSVYVVSDGNQGPESRRRSPPSTENGESAKSLLKKTLKLCGRLDVILLFITVFIGGIANSLYLNFTLKYVVETMGHTKAEASYVIIATATSSVITFPCTARIIKLFGGTINAITVALLAMCVRLLIISFSIPFEAFVAVHLLNGFAFGLFYSSTMEHVLAISPKEILMTMNNITLSLFFYVSALVGNIGGSGVFNEYGGAKLFLGQSILCGVWVVVMFGYIARNKICVTCSAEEEE